MDHAINFFCNARTISGVLVLPRVWYPKPKCYSTRQLTCEHAYTMNTPITSYSYMYNNACMHATDKATCSKVSICTTGQAMQG